MELDVTGPSAPRAWQYTVVDAHEQSKFSRDVACGKSGKKAITEGGAVGEHAGGLRQRKGRLPIGIPHRGEISTGGKGQIALKGCDLLAFLIFSATVGYSYNDPPSAQPWTPGVLAQLVSSLRTCKT